MTLDRDCDDASAIILTQRCFIHGHAISRKKEDTDIYSQQFDHGFSRHISLKPKIPHCWKN